MSASLMCVMPRFTPQVLLSEIDMRKLGCSGTNPAKITAASVLSLLGEGGLLWNGVSIGNWSLLL